MLLFWLVTLAAIEVASGEIALGSQGDLRLQQDASVCQLEPVRGTCRALLRRYFYNPVVNECREFFYGGCGGNANNFLTKYSCESACRRPVPGGNDPLSIDCRLPIDAGPCRGSFLRWAFNGAYCQEFTYGGCGGNWNRFETSEDCETNCGTSQPVVNPLPPAVVEPAPPGLPPLDQLRTATGATFGPICSWPLHPGPCNGYFLKWGFQNGRCVEFVYGGCGGNANRFDRQVDCEQRCGAELAAQNLAIQSQLPTRYCPPLQVQAPPVGCEMQPVTRPNGCPGYDIRCTEGICASNPCTGLCEYCVNEPSLCPPGMLCLGYRCLIREGCLRPGAAKQRRSPKHELQLPPSSPEAAI